MRSLFLKYVLIMAFMLPKPTQAKIITMPRCILLELDSQVQCWAAQKQKSILRGSTLNFLGARPKIKGKISAFLTPLKEMNGPPVNEVSLPANQKIDIQGNIIDYTVILKAENKVILKVPLSVVEPQFQYAVISIDGKDEIIRDGSTIKIDSKSDFLIKEVRTNVLSGVSIIIEPKSSMFDELQIHYKEQVLGRAFIQKKGRF